MICPLRTGIIFLHFGKMACKAVNSNSALYTGIKAPLDAWLDWFLFLKLGAAEVVLSECSCSHFVMPPPLGAGGIMFSGCPSVRLSVRPSIRPKPEIPSFDLYMGPLVHPTNRNRFTSCPSVKFWISGNFPENAWRKWHEILQADLSWPPTELISLWLRSVDF